MNDATGLPGGDSRFFLASIGFITLDATGLPGGGSRFGVAGILTAFKTCKLHWASQWHLLNASEPAREKNVNTPLGKPVAS